MNSPASRPAPVQGVGSKEHKKEAERKKEGKGERPPASLAVSVPPREEVFTIPPGLSPTGFFSPVVVHDFPMVS